MAQPGGLESLLAAGRFVVTAEVTPPLSANPGALLARAAPLKGKADAVNVTDGAGARVTMSSLAAAAILAREGIEPVLQISATSWCCTATTRRPATSRTPSPSTTSTRVT
jgi:5,10-methylenetetrahydrofolate reductase